MRRVFCWLLIVVSASGAVVSTYLRTAGYEMAGSYLDVLPIAVGIALAALLVVRVPVNNMTFVLCLVVAFGTWVDLDPPLRAQALQNGNEALAVLIAQAGTGVFFVFYLSLFILLPLWFPTGSAITPKWEWVQRLAVASMSIALALTVLASETCVVGAGDECSQIAPTPWGFVPLGTVWADNFFLLGALMVLPAVWSLVRRFRRSRGVERQQLKYMVPSVLLIAVFFIAQQVSVEAFGFDLFVDQLFWIVLTLALGSFSLAILKYRLYDIDRLVSRTISYSIVVGLLAAAVAIVATGVATLFDSPLAVAATTLAVAAAFNPLRRRVQRWVDRRFNRSRFDAERVMDEFAHSLRDEVDESEVVNGWVRAVSATMQPSSVGVWLR